MTTVLYCRVSTLDQTVEHQRTQALQVGFTPDLAGVSTRLCERPEGRRLFDLLRAGDTHGGRVPASRSISRNFGIESMLRFRSKRNLNPSQLIKAKAFVGHLVSAVRPSSSKSLNCFRMDFTVREVAAALKMSKTEAGRLRIRALGEGLLAAGHGGDRLGTNGHNAASWGATDRFSPIQG